MKGIRFYEELVEALSGNVIAIDAETPLLITEGNFDCLSALCFEPNSPVCAGAVSQEYLQENCKRISEVKAREIHPRLFERLDD